MPKLTALLILSLVATAAGAQAPVGPCDELGANPDDFDRVAPGVFWTVLDGRTAEAACKDALARHPDEARFMYQYGRALARLGRNDEAIAYLSRAADAGYLIAYTTLGSIYHFVTRDYAEAVRWYTEGAELGSASAQVHLGDMYREGLGVRKDIRRALQWYDKASAQNYALAHAKIGELYEVGDGVPQDYVKAAGYYENAANLNLPRAQHALAHLLLNGQGMVANPETARRWYGRAANQGYGASQVELGRLAENSGDVETAYFWYAVAAVHRDSTIQAIANDGLDRLKRSVKRSDRKRISREAANWRPDVIMPPMRSGN